MNDRVQQWRTFAAVAERRSFSRAAIALRQSPQSVTRAVAALEQRLGVRLLHRTTRAVSLTDAGARLLGRSQPVLTAFDELEAGEPGPPRGALAVTASVLFGQRHVLPIVAEFLAAHPSVSVRLVLLDRVVALAEEGVDLAIRIGALPDSTLRARLVGHVRQVVCASPGYLARRGIPRHPRQLIEHDCVTFTGPATTPERWSFAGGRRAQSFAVRSRLVVNTGQAAVEAAVAGLGVTRVLSYQIEDQLARRRLVRVLQRHEPPPMPIHLLHPPGLQPRAASAFLDLAALRLRARFG